MPSSIIILHPATVPVGEWASHVPAAPVVLPEGADAGAVRAALDHQLRHAECVLIDAAAADPLRAARLVHAMDPDVQVVVVVAPERRGALEHAMLFAPGLGELWLASPEDVRGELPERAAGVTRKRRKFRRTRERMQHEWSAESMQRAERAFISDAYLATLVQVLPEAIFSLDEHGRILSANPAVATLLGRPEHTVVGHPLAEVLAPGDGKTIRAALTPAPGEHTRTELRFHRGDGRQGYGELVVAPVLIDAMRVWVAILHDLTEREADREQLRRQAAELEQQVEESQSLAEELEQSNEELQEAMEALDRARAEAEAANRSKMNFLAAMSHELRTPLNAIAGYVQLLEYGVRGPITAEQRADLQRIMRSERYLLSLVNDVLNFAKLDTGSVSFRIVTVSADTMLAGLEDLIAPQLHTRRLAFAYEPADPAVAVYADPEKVQQILLNLLGNAIKFTAPGGRITVSCDVRPDAVRINVADTGTGIAPEDMETIFEPFVQVDRQLNNPAEGTGLGLAISRDLARAMHGDVSAESELGRGSTFTLTLPRSADATPARASGRS